MSLRAQSLLKSWLNLFTCDILSVSTGVDYKRIPVVYFLMNSNFYFCLYVTIGRQWVSWDYSNFVNDTSKKDVYRQTYKIRLQRVKKHSTCDKGILGHYIRAGLLSLLMLRWKTLIIRIRIPAARSPSIPEGNIAIAAIVNSYRILVLHLTHFICTFFYSAPKRPSSPNWVH